MNTASGGSIRLDPLAATSNRGELLVGCMSHQVGPVTDPMSTLIKYFRTISAADGYPALPGADAAYIPLPQEVCAVLCCAVM